MHTEYKIKYNEKRFGMAVTWDLHKVLFLRMVTFQLRGFKRQGFGRTTQYHTMIGTFVHVIRNETVFGNCSFLILYFLPFTVDVFTM